MSALKFILGVWLIGALMLFLLFMFGNYNVKITRKHSTEQKIYFATGIKKVGICILTSILWPYIFIRNLIKGE